MKNIYDDSIILIGPSGAGKSTVAEVFTKRGMPRLCLDVIANRAEVDGRAHKVREKAMQEGKNTWDECNLALIQHVTNIQKQAGVCDFGAGHAIFKTSDGLERAKKIFQKYKNIVFILPCKDKEKALEIMANRSKGDHLSNKEFLESGCYEKLATMVVYADDKTPEAIADEISAEIEKRKKNISKDEFDF